MLLLLVTFMKFHSVSQLRNNSVTASHISFSISTKQVGTVFYESHLLS